MPPLIVNERIAVSDQVLKIADLRSVDRRKVDFVYNSCGQCKPEPTRGRIGCADRVFVTPRPPRFNAGLTKCFTIVCLRLHFSDPFIQCLRSSKGSATSDLY